MLENKTIYKIKFMNARTEMLNIKLLIAHSHLDRLPQGLAAYGIYGCDIKIARLVCLRH